MSKVTFANTNSGFHTTINQRVEAYFKETGLPKTGTTALYVKGAVLVSAALALYGLLLFVPLHWAVALLCSSLFGIVLAGIGFNIMHDACHGGFSVSQRVNDIAGLSLNCLGGNAFIWKLKHNIVHHTYTNVDGVDDDIAKLPLIRQCGTQKWNPAHRAQHFYMFLIYGLSSFLWAAVMDFQKYFSGMVYRTPMSTFPLKEHIIFWVSKVLFIAFYVALPIHMVGFMPWLVGFAVMQVSMGLTLAMVFQLAHVVEGVHFDEAYEGGKLENEWAKHQVMTTANFAMHSKAVSWYVGGLNFQIEHHLFPRVSHVHYPAIAPIVQQVCREYNVPYTSFPTVAAAFASHYRFMRWLGQRGDAAQALAAA